MKFLWIGCLCLGMLSCTQAPKVQVQGAMQPTGLSTIDSVKCKLRFSFPDQAGETKELSAMLFAVPAKRYRLEFNGPMGIQVASMLWNPTGWILLIPSEERGILGVGDTVRIPGAVLPAIPIHQMLSFAWGVVLPPGGDSATSVPYQSHVLRSWVTPQGQSVRSEEDPQTRRILAVTFAADDPANEIRMVYKDDEVRIFQAARWVLTVQILNRKPNASWGKGIWNLKIPEGWKLQGVQP
jgi:hypothetical protein